MDLEEGLNPWYGVAITAIVWAFFILIFYVINKWMKERNRIGLIAFFFGIVSPGSGFAYSAAYTYAWITYALTIASMILILLSGEQDLYTIIFAIVFIIQAFAGSSYAHRAGRKLRKKRHATDQKAMEKAYLKDLASYIETGHHVAVDTNFLMHFYNVLTDLYENTNVQLFLHPTVFGELEGLKKSENRNTRASAQMGFDVIEMFQKGNRMQWTRKQPQGTNFSSADQRIVTGVLGEIRRGVKLVFASHDKGARILARSLQIPVVDPLEDGVTKVKKASVNMRKRGIE
ncbi:hypothetical protein D8M04_00365 [Oceanobacillus piezotolerans]|uniref:PIN domain-containing protein n=1 Tax=Oceanobacillus piezotolerans TaxID=2448030 RepID=A0A498DGZ9_9BACI|nr:hypothetical protein D8M04_00365 [Oceanobacillus piezotolerans]